MNHDIFISYSREDKKAVFPLINKINDELGTHCWVDLNGIECGEQFEDKIMGAIDASKIVLFLLSDNSLRTPWTKREVYYAEKHKKKIIPVVVDGDCLRGWFLFHFGSVDYIDIKSKDQCDKMIKDLKKWVNPDKEETLEKKTKDNKTTNDNNHTPKNKLWFVVAAIVAVMVLLTVFLKQTPTDDNTIKEEETVVVKQESPDDVDFNNCKTIADYREYMAIYGRRGIHYKEAKQTVDKLVADSMAKTKETQEVQAQAEAKKAADVEAKQKADAERIQKKAEAEAKAKHEAEQKDAYNKCTTIAACDNYLILYPNGKYISEVKAKKKELEKLDDQNKAEEEKRKPEEAKKRDGVFSVSSTKKVEFSKGNLQYQASTKTWRFAENQWDMIGDANKNISSSYSGWIDLFGWGTGDNPTKSKRLHLSYSNFSDWGNNIISNGSNKKWFTLTKDEWIYVLAKRSTDSGIRYAKAEVNGVFGLILLPDNWNGKDYELNKTNNYSANFLDNIISQSDWISKLEANGAVFLPAAGYRNGTDFYTFTGQGNYWSASVYNSNNAYKIYFGGYWFDVSHNFRYYGCSIRLVSLADN